jgi:hypothetical protein
MVQAALAYAIATKGHSNVKLMMGPVNVKVASPRLLDVVNV